MKKWFRNIAIRLYSLHSHPLDTTPLTLTSLCRRSLHFDASDIGEQKEPQEGKSTPTLSEVDPQPFGIEGASKRTKKMEKVRRRLRKERATKNTTSQ